MRRIIYIYIICLLTHSCQREELIYGYDPTLKVQINLDWSNMSSKPSGVSVYCYPEDGGSATIVQSNSVDTLTVNLPIGTYNILVLNQTPSDFGTMSFSGMNSFETAEVYSASTESSWVSAQVNEGLVRDPDYLAVATYLDIDIPEDVVKEKLGIISSETRSSFDNPFHTISLQPAVVVRTTRVRIRISGIYNLSSTRATLFGMSSGYHFFNQSSHSGQVTHLLESWSTEVYLSDYREGEVVANFTSFGFPDHSTTTRSDSSWNGNLDIDMLLVDQSTIISKSLDLSDKISTYEDGSINIDYGYSESESDNGSPISLPDVESVDGTGSGFDATVDDWGDENDFVVAM